MRYFAAFLVAIVTALPVGAKAADPAETAPARVIVLGVDHGTQLVSSKDQPGVLGAYLESLRPDAICIERPPEQAARNDYYEYTYEVQGIILPFAERTDTALCPIDWMPPVEDQKLGFGLDLDTPLFLRRPAGFQGFLSFPDPAVLERDFFASDTSDEGAKVRQWASQPPARADQDLPRRLYLYRTFMQAQRIRAAAAARPGKTILVVIGYFHKPDIEAILAHDPAIELVPATSHARPDDAAVTAATSTRQLTDIALFNIMGVQADTGVVDWAWVGSIVDRLEREAPGPAAVLLRTRYDLLTGTITPRQAITRYRSLADAGEDDARFDWTGVEDASRIDSYFDPFGNLTIRQRAAVELARTLYALGRMKEGDRVIDGLVTALPERKGQQLSGYARRLRDAKKS